MWKASQTFCIFSHLILFVEHMPFLCDLTNVKDSKGKFHPISKGGDKLSKYLCGLTFIVCSPSVIGDEDADRVWSCVENAIQMMADEEAEE